MDRATTTKGDECDRKTIDAPLNSTGQAQAVAAQAEAQSYLPDLVVSSAMRRTMETAAIVWAHVAGRATFLCHDGCREVDSSHVKARFNQRRTSAQNSAERYGEPPGIVFDFSPELVAEDVAEANRRESDSEVGRRLNDFMAWLLARPETHIAVVGHTLVFEQ